MKSKLIRHGNKAKVINEGKEIECEILFTFSENSIDYIVYIDGTKDETGEYEIYASRYSFKDGEYYLEEIEEEFEWDLIDRMLEKRLSEIGE